MFDNLDPEVDLAARIEPQLPFGMERAEEWDDIGDDELYDDPENEEQAKYGERWGGFDVGGEG